MVLIETWSSLCHIDHNHHHCHHRSHPHPRPEIYHGPNRDVAFYRGWPRRLLRHHKSCLSRPPLATITGSHLSFLYHDQPGRDADSAEFLDLQGIARIIQVIFQAGLLFSRENAKIWHVLAHFGKFWLISHYFTHFLAYFLQGGGVPKWQIWCMLHVISLHRFHHPSKERHNRASRSSGSVISLNELCIMSSEHCIDAQILDLYSSQSRLM